MGIFRLHQFGVRNAGLLASAVRLLSLPLVAFARLGLSCEVPGSIACGRRLVLAHGGRGIIVVSDAVLGDDVVMAPFSALGARTPPPGHRSSGTASTSGPTPPCSARSPSGTARSCGARALVLQDLAPGTVALGVPARIAESSSLSATG